MTELVVVVAVVVLIITVAGALLVRASRSDDFTTSRLTQEERDRVSAELLEYIETQSYAKDRHVNLRLFWETRSVSLGDRKLILDPLLKTNKLLVPTNASLSPWEQAFEALGRWIWTPLPDTVALSERDFNRMTHGPRSKTKLGKVRLMSKTKNIKFNGLGNIVEKIAGSGNPVTACGRDTRVVVDVENLSADQLRAFADALRVDAQSMDGTAKRTVLDLASEVEEERDHPEAGRLWRLLKTATEYVNLLTGGMKATDGFLKSVDHLT